VSWRAESTGVGWFTVNSMRFGKAWENSRRQKWWKSMGAAWYAHSGARHGFGCRPTNLVLWVEVCCRDQLFRYPVTLPARWASRRTMI